VKEFNDGCLLERGNKNNDVFFWVVCWTLWLNRNNWVFRNRLISYPNTILYKKFYTIVDAFELRGGTGRTGEAY
jgi:hypothetical protein